MAAIDLKNVLRVLRTYLTERDLTVADLTSANIDDLFSLGITKSQVETLLYQIENSVTENFVLRKSGRTDNFIDSTDEIEKDEYSYIQKFGDDKLYFVDRTRDLFYKINKNGTQVTNLGTALPSEIEGLYFAPNGDLYALDDGNNDIYKINLSDIAASEVIMNLGGGNWDSLAIDSDNTFYSILSDLNNPGKLYSINIADKTKTELGNLVNNNAKWYSLAFHPDGTLYAINFNDKSLYTIDKSSGEATKYGTISDFRDADGGANIYTRQWEGMTFDSEGKLYAVDYYHYGQGSKIYKFDISDPDNIASTSELIYTHTIQDSLEVPKTGQNYVYSLAFNPISYKIVQRFKNTVKDTLIKSPKIYSVLNSDVDTEIAKLVVDTTELTDISSDLDLVSYSTTAQVDAKDKAILAAAKSYTDTNAPNVDLSAYYTKTQSDAKDATTLSDAKAFTFSQAQITEKDADTLTAAKANTYDKHLTDIKGSNDKVSFPANKVIVDLTIQAVLTSSGSNGFNIEGYLDGIKERHGSAYTNYEDLPAQGSLSGTNAFKLYGNDYKVSAFSVRADSSDILSAANALQLRFDSLWELHDLDRADFWGKHKMVLSRGDESITIDHMWIDYGYTLAPRWSCDDSTNPYLVDGDGNPSPPGKTNGTQISNDFVPESEEKYWTTALATKTRGIMSVVEGETFNLKIIQDKFTFYSGEGIFDVVPPASVGYDGYKCVVGDKEYTRKNGAWVLKLNTETKNTIRTELVDFNGVLKLDFAPFYLRTSDGGKTLANIESNAIFYNIVTNPTPNNPNTVHIKDSTLNRHIYHSLKKSANGEDVYFRAVLSAGQKVYYVCRFTGVSPISEHDGYITAAITGFEWLRREPTSVFEGWDKITSLQSQSAFQLWFLEATTPLRKLVNANKTATETRLDDTDTKINAILSKNSNQDSTLSSIQDHLTNVTGAQITNLSNKNNEQDTEIASIKVDFAAGDSTTLQSAKDYTYDKASIDSKDEATLDAAKAYTNANAGSGGGGYTDAEIDTAIATAKTEAIGAGQELYAIWQASHGNPTSTTNAASRPVAGFSGAASWDATNERVNVGKSTGTTAGRIYWENSSIDFRRCVLTAEVVLGPSVNNNRGRSFVFILGSPTNTLSTGNQLEIAIDLDGFDHGAPAGTRQIYIWNKTTRSYLGSKILQNELTVGQKLEFKAVVDVEEITIYLDGVEVWHLTGANVPVMDGPFFGCVGNYITTQVYAIAIQQLDLDLAAPRLQLPVVSDAVVGKNMLTLNRRGASPQILNLKVVETKKDVFLSPVYDSDGTYKGGGVRLQTVVTKTQTPLDNPLKIPITENGEPFVPAAGTYNLIDIAVLKEDWDKTNKVEIWAAHASQAILSFAAEIYQYELTSEPKTLIASGAGYRRAHISIHLNEDENSAASTTKHRIRIQALDFGTNDDELYLGEVRLVFLSINTG